MTTPTSESYLKARLDIVKKYEIGAKVDTAFYLDGSGYPTIGYGTLVAQDGTAAAFAQTVIDNSTDPAFTRKLVDALSGVTGGTATAKQSLEGKGFVFEGTRMVSFKDGKDANGVDIVKDIRNVLPEASALKVFDVVAAKKETIVDGLEKSLEVTFTESQRLEVLSRVYNGLPERDVRKGLIENGVEGAIAFFSSNRGSQSNPGQYARTIEEAQGYLGDKVTPAEVGNAEGFTYKNSEGQDVFIGSQRIVNDKGKLTGAEIVAYKITQNADGTQNQVPLPLPGLESRMRLASTLPLDPGFELNNAIESGNLREIFKAQALNPDNKTPAELLASFKDLNPEIGEKKTFNIGTDKKPRNIEGYEVVDEDGKTTIFATGKDPKTGKVGVVTLEKKAPSETDPEPKLHGVDLLPQQATQYRLKVSDAGDLEGPQYASADAADVLAGMGGHPVVLADTGGGTSDAATTLEEAMARAIVERVERADAWGKALQEEFGEPVNVVANADGTKSIVNDAGEVLGTVKVEHDAVTLARTDGGQISVSEEGQANVQFPLDAISAPLPSTNLNVTDLSTLDLSSQFTGGAYGAGQLAGFDVLPFNDTSSFLVNADGDIAGEIRLLPNGYSQLKDLGGNSVYISDSGQPFTQDQYEQAQTQQLSQAQASQAASAIGLMNTIIGLQHWDNMSDLQRTAALASIYNVADQLTGGKALPGDLGTAASALGLLNALDKGDIGGIAYSGLSLVEHLTYDTATKMGWVGANMPGGESFLPGLGFVLALDSGDPVSIASSGMALMSSLGWIGPWGMVAGAVISVFGGLLGDDPQPPEGHAHFMQDGSGRIYPVLDEDISGGGGAAMQIAQGVAGALNGWLDTRNAQLAAQNQNVDLALYGAALDAGALPKIGWRNGLAVVEYTDDLSRSRGISIDLNQQPEALMRAVNDVIVQRHALVSTWQLSTLQARQAAGLEPARIPQAQGSDDNPDSHSQHFASLAAELPEHVLQQLRQSAGAPDTGRLLLQAMTQTSGYANERLIDVDGDGYLERTPWLSGHQALLGVDMDGDQLLGDAREFLTVGVGLNGVNWLDANRDLLLDAKDPAFGALLLWADVNGDGAQQSGERLRLHEAGVLALDLASWQLVWADGSRTAVSRQQTQADTEGTQLSSVRDAEGRELNAGLIVQQEGYEGMVQLTGTAVEGMQAQTADGKIAVRRMGWGTHLALRTGDWEGTAEQDQHRHGGQTVAPPALTTANAAVGLDALQREPAAATTTRLDAGDSRLIDVAPSGAAPSVSQALREVTHAMIRSAEQTAGAAQVRNNGIVFVPAGAVGAGAQMREAAEDMVRSAETGGFAPLAALAIGAAAVQWPTVAVAAPQAQDANAAPAVAPATQAAAERIDWQAWEGSRASIAAPGNPTPAPEQTVTPITWAFTSGQAGASANAAPEPPAPLEWAYPTITPPATATNITNATSGRSSALASAQATHDEEEAQADGAAAPLALASTLLDYPEVRGEQYSSLEDTGLRFLETVLLANDSTVNSPAHPDEPSLRISSVFAPVHGSVSLQTNAQGVVEVMFLPEANYHGPASFDYTVTDQYGLSNNARVSLAIAAVNDAPVTQNGNAAGTEDTDVYFAPGDLLGSASDVDTVTDRQQLSISGIVAAQHGVAVLMPDGRIRFTPEADYNAGIDGSASFIYNVSDSAGGVAPVTMWVSLAPVNDTPRLQDESTHTLEDQALSINTADLLANDFDVDNLHADLRISAVSDAIHGSVVLQAQPDGSTRIVFAPEANFHGIASFRYTVTDPSGTSSTATARVVVAAVNDVPVTQDSQVSGVEDTAVYFTGADLLVNASDADTATDSQQLSISAIVAANHGVATLMPDGRVRFTPDADYNQGLAGPASFTYSVTDGAGGVTPATVWLSLAAVNDAPRLQDETTNALEDQVLSIAMVDLLANDSDVDDLHADLRITAVSDAVHGSVALQAQPDGSTRVVFTPEANFHGIASFRYTVVDTGGASSTATTQVVVAAVNDVPVTQDGNISSVEDTVLDFAPADLLASASDPDTATDGQQLSISAITAARHGVAVLMPDGRIRFTPDADYNAGIDGPASFTYSVSDSAGGVTPATVWVSLAAVNDAPDVRDEFIRTLEDEALSIATTDLLANDSDVDDAHADLRISTVSNAAHGSVAIQAQPDGSSRIVFTPDANYHGQASFDYTVTDPGGQSSNARVNLDIAAVEDAPVTQDGHVSSVEDTVLIFTSADLLASASDADSTTDGQQLSISAIVAARHGVAVLLPDGRIRFTPDADYNEGIEGPASFTYNVSDGAGGVTPATVWVSLAAANDAPRLQGESTSTQEDQALSIAAADLLANDFDVDNPHSDLRVSAVSDAVHGSVARQVQPDGSSRIVFTPEADYHGIASFSYTVTDTGGASSTATARVVVGPVNDAPVTQDSQVSGTEDTAVYFTQADLLANARDVDTATDNQQLFINGIVAVQHGVAVLMPDGRIRFTPDADYNESVDGPASFTYGVSDGAGGVTPATVWVSLAAVNDAPRLQDETTNTLEDQVLSISTADLLANDSDVDNTHTDLRIAAVSDATHGSVALQAQPDGSTRVVFTPEANYHGLASFRYTVADLDGASSTATTQVVVASVNDAPVTQDSQVSGTEDTAIYFTSTELLASASDVDTATDNQQLSISAILAAQNGVAVLMPDGRIRFTPDADYNQGIGGLASFTYGVSDGAGGVTPATVWVSLVAVNDAPRLQDETANAVEDQVLSIDPSVLLANDGDVDDLHADLRISAVSDAIHGSVALQAQPDGSTRIVFTPEANFHGLASFRYTVTDPSGASSTATTQIAVTAVNDAPVIQDSQVSGTEDTALYFTNADLLASASDVDTVTDNQQLFISAIVAARHGVAVFVPDGRIRFTPDADYNASIDGPASFSYSVSDGAGGVTPATVWVSLAAVNDAPRLQDESTNTLEDRALSIDPSVLLANDGDVDDLHADLRISAVSDAVHGSAALQAQPDGSTRIVFTPEANFHGIASFRYTVTDPSGASSTATTQVVVASVNDAPVTQDSQVSGTEDTAFYLTRADLLANASDVDTATDGQQLSISAIVVANHGVATLMADGRVRFIPDADYNQGMSGLASFIYTVSDGAGGVTPATVWLSLAPVNDAPRLQDESANALEDQVLSIATADLLANDSDVDDLRADLRISSVSDATHGSVALQTQADGSSRVIFTPEANYHGTASFRYTVTDPGGASSVATARVVLAAVNDAPVTQDGNVSGVEDTALYFSNADLLATASDPDTVTDGQQLSVSAITAARHGVAVLMPDGRIRFTPDPDYNAGIDGPASFTYSVSDSAGGVTPATVWVSLAAVNDAPRLQDETTNALEDQVLSIATADLLANDSDVDNTHADLRISAVSDATHGSVALQAQPDGSTRIVFTPEANYHGIASFRYTVTDPGGASSMATARIALAAVNDAPVTQGETASGNEDTALLFTAASLLANDSDVDTAVDEDVLRITRVGMAEHGQVFLQPDGTVRFEPNADYNGPAKFSYWVGDRDPASIATGNGYETAATVNLTILAVNDLPVVTGETMNSDEDIILTINPALLLANDTDVDTATTNAEPAQVLSVTAVGNAQHGSVAFDSQGNVIFTPDADYNGVAQFSYTVDDGTGSSSGLTESVARIIIAPIPDLPAVLDETVSSSEDQVLTFSAAALLANDRNPDGPQTDLALTRVGDAQHGTVALNEQGDVVFTPEADYAGSAGFAYWVGNGPGGEARAVVALRLAPVNDAPASQGEAITGGQQDAPLQINATLLLANDSDVDDAHTALRLGWVGDALHGSVAIDAQGDVVFTPETGFKGVARFAYQVLDEAGAASPRAVVQLPFAPSNHAPLAVDDRFDSYRGSHMVISAAQLLGNDSDADGDALGLGAVRAAQHGTVWLDGANVHFDLEPGYLGAASFEYLASDGRGGQTWAQAFVQVRHAPTQYPTLEINYPAILTSADNSQIDSGWIDYTLHDESPLTVAWRYLSGSADGVALSQQQLHAVVDAPAHQVQFDVDYTAANGRHVTTASNVSVTWELQDDQGAINHVTTQLSYPPANAVAVNEFTGLATPVVLDLGENGVQFLAPGGSGVAFDLHHDGRLQSLAWAGPEDGVLAWDRNASGTVDEVDEFAFACYVPGAQTDLEGLRAFDSNANDLLDAGDAHWHEFGVWQLGGGDDGESAGAGWFRSLDAMGIASIALQSDGQTYDAAWGVTVMGTAHYTTRGGERHAALDAAFAAMNVTKDMPMSPPTSVDAVNDTACLPDTTLTTKVSGDTHTGTTIDVPPVNADLRTDVQIAQDASDAQLMHLALLFNRMVNTADPEAHAPLGFVPIAPDTQWHDIALMADQHAQQHTPGA